MYGHSSSRRSLKYETHACFLSDCPLCLLASGLLASARGSNNSLRHHHARLGSLPRSRPMMLLTCVYVERDHGGVFRGISCWGDNMTDNTLIRPTVCPFDVLFKDETAAIGPNGTHGRIQTVTTHSYIIQYNSKIHTGGFPRRRGVVVAPKLNRKNPKNVLL